MKESVTRMYVAAARGGSDNAVRGLIEGDAD